LERSDDGCRVVDLKEGLLVLGLLAVGCMVGIVEGERNGTTVGEEVGLEMSVHVVELTSGIAVGATVEFVMDLLVVGLKEGVLILDMM